MRSSAILEANDKLSLRDFSLTQATDIGDIDFFVPAALKKPSQVFLILKDVETGLREVAELKETLNGYNKPVFRLPLTCSLRLNNARVEMKLLIVDIATDTMSYSTPVTALLSTQNFKLARETSMVRELSDSIVCYYEAIVKVLQEVIEKGDNAE